MERENNLLRFQRRPYNRLSEAMAEIAQDLNQARLLVKVLERQYQMLEIEFAKQLPPLTPLE